MRNFKTFLVDGMEANEEQIAMFLDRSLMLVTALSPVIGHDEASKVAHFALSNDLTLREAALELHVVDEADFDRLVDPTKMIGPSVVTSKPKRTDTDTARGAAGRRRAREAPKA